MDSNNRKRFIKKENTKKLKTNKNILEDTDFEKEDSVREESKEKNSVREKECIRGESKEKECVREESIKKNSVKEESKEKKCVREESEEKECAREKECAGEEGKKNNSVREKECVEKKKYVKRGRKKKECVKEENKDKECPKEERKKYKDPDEELAINYYQEINNIIKKNIKNKKSKHINDVCYLNSNEYLNISFTDALKLSNCDWNSFITFENNKIYNNYMNNNNLIYPDENKLLKILIVDMMRKQKELEEKIYFLENKN
jgi:hypothetical protein